MASKPEPRFPHDCKKCTFVGHFLYGSVPVDGYVCTASIVQSVIMRYGEHGDYSSVPRLSLTEEYRQLPSFKTHFEVLDAYNARA